MGHTTKLGTESTSRAGSRLIIVSCVTSLHYMRVYNK